MPVSAALMARLMVSRSRISPTRITSGSSRRAARKALVKLSECSPICRWFRSDILFSWMNSRGSSRVRMCSLRVALIRSIMAARVVDLPEPVGRDEHEPLLEVGHLSDPFRQSQVVGRKDLARDDPENRGQCRGGSSGSCPGSGQAPEWRRRNPDRAWPRNRRSGFSVRIS